LANPKVRVAYDALAPEFEIAVELLTPLRAGFSQAELGTRMGTSQSTIARLESGQMLPSTKTLLRYAEVTVYSVYGLKSFSYNDLDACIDYNARVLEAKKTLNELARDAAKDMKSH
jgi:transcriptional regulator with XRE-family HTH domain